MLEVAYFTPERIARTGQALGLTSDARSRFERGVDPGVPRRRAGDPDRADPRHLRRRSVRGDARRRAAGRASASSPSTCGRTRALGGIDVPEAAAARDPRPPRFRGRRQWRRRSRRWRRDVDGPADLVEEIARIVGYDQVPSTPLDRAPGVARPTATRAQMVERRVRRTAAARGLDEAVTWSFISEAEAARSVAATGGSPTRSAKT